MTTPLFPSVIGHNVLDGGTDAQDGNNYPGPLLQEYAAAVVGAGRRKGYQYQKRDWTKVTDFTGTWTASGSGTTSVTSDNALSDAQQLRLWTPSAAGETLTIGTLGAGNHFKIGGAGTVGILFYTPSDTTFLLRVTLGQGGYTNTKNFLCVVGARRAGWQFLAFDAGMTSADGPGAVPGAASWETGGSGTFVGTVDRIQVQMATNAVPIYLHSIWRGGRDRAQIVIGFDNPALETNNLYEEAFPLFESYGYKGYMAFATDTAYLPWNTTYRQPKTMEMVQAGWEVINHSHTHTDAITLGTAEAIIADYQASIEVLTDRGFGEFAGRFGAWPQNTTTKLAKDTLAGMGFQCFRSLPRRYHSVPPVGGFLDPLEVGSVDMPLMTATQIIAQIDSAIRLGASLHLFAHGIVKDGDPADGSITGDGLNIYLSTLRTVLEAVYVRQLAGKCDVPSFSQWYELTLANAT